MAKKKKVVTNKELDLMKPVDLTSLSSELDCFGKEYDLSTDECKRCGDSEYCAIACSINLTPERKQLAQETKFKDEHQTDIPFEVHSFIEKKLDRGTDDSKIVSRLVKRFKVSNTVCIHLTI